ncbi:hypothetical protein OJ998_01825 [Solirubrobacter taibaiensis]|nr:hypothetical protein [Solirubrobacter taibaiensis]
MSALSLAASMGYEDYRPHLVVDAVNELHPLGREGALDAVAAEEGLGCFWVLRVLFDPPLPPVRLGEPVPAPPADTLERFPIVLALDVPFLVVRGYDLGGKAQPVSAHIDELREHGRLREQPLRPATDPEAVHAAFVAEWRGAFGDEGLAEVEPLVDRQLISVG